MGMIPKITYRIEPDGNGTRFTRRVDAQVSGPSKAMKPMMGMMVRKYNRRWSENLKNALS